MIFDDGEAGRREPVLSDLAVGYLFLGGAGAGACLVLCAMGLFVPRAAAFSSAGARERLRPSAAHRALFGPGFAAALVALLGGVVCLAADAGSIDRVVLLFVHPAWSHLAVGAWALAACLALAAALGLAWAGAGSWSVAAFRAICAVGAVVALAVAVYTGLLLQSIGAVPLWSSPALPVLFVLSSASCGIALVLGAAQLSGAAGKFGVVMRRLAAADAAVVVAEALAAVALVLGAQGGAGFSAGTPSAAAATAAVAELMTGELAWLFWGGFAAAGLAAPLVLDVLLARGRRPMPGLALAAAACVLVGGLIMRYCIVEAGMRPVLAFAGG